MAGQLVDEQTGWKMESAAVAAIANMYGPITDEREEGEGEISRRSR
jgi:hypothetical protein